MSILSYSYHNRYDSSQSDTFYLFNVHRYNMRENNITKGNSMPLTGDKTVTVTVTINGLVKLSAFNAHICPSK